LPRKNGVFKGVIAPKKKRKGKWGGERGKRGKGEASAGGEKTVPATRNYAPGTTPKKKQKKAAVFQGVLYLVKLQTPPEQRQRRGGGTQPNSEKKCFPAPGRDPRPGKN